MNTLTLFSSQVILAELLEKLGVNSHTITSHSFGEFAALVHSGMASFETVFEIIYKRESYLPFPHAVGVMIAVRESADNIKNIFYGQQVFIANINSNLQTVISVPNSQLEIVKKILKDKRISAQVLTQVVHPFHSPLLEQFQSDFKNYLTKLDLKLQPIKIAFVSCSDSVLYNKDNFSTYDLPHSIVGQLVRPVNFPNQVNKIIENKIYNFVEIGPTSSCVQFVKQIVSSPHLKANNLAYYLNDNLKSDSMTVNLNAKQSELFKKFSQTIGEFTGYEIDTISFTQKFQDDLGIDSLKKAEIILSFLETSQIQVDDSFSLSNFKNVGDVIDFITKSKGGIKKNKTLKVESSYKRYEEILVPQELLYYPFLSPEVCFVKLDEIISRPEESIIKIQKELENYQQDYNVSSTAICFLVNFNFDISKITYDQVESIYLKFTSFVDSLLQTLEKFTKNSHLVLLSDNDNYVMASSLSLFLKSLKKEINVFNSKLIVLEKSLEQNELKKIIQKEVNDILNQDVYYTNNLVRNTYSLVEKASPEKIKFPSREQVIVCIGGGKGILFELLKGILSELKGAVVYIIGRSSINDVDINKNINILRKIHANVFYSQLNVNDSILFNEHLDNILKKHGVVDFLINSAGIEYSKTFALKTHQEISQELNSKILPVINLNSLDLSKVKNVILFSSIVSYFGNGGQTSYAFSNRFLDIYSREIFKNRKDTVVKIIHWPPWNGIGMTKNPGLMQKFKEILVSLLSVDTAQEFFNSILFDAKSESTFFMNESDFFIMDCLLSNIKEALFPLGKLADSAHNVFEKEYSLITSPYLQDHKINNIVLLPAVYAITHFYFIAYLHEKRIPLIKNFQVFNVVIISRDVTKVKVQYKTNYVKKKYKCFLDTKIKNVTADVEFNEVTQDLGTIVNNDAFIRFKKAKIESIYSPKCIDYGFFFQMLKEVYVDKDNNVQVAINNSSLNSMTESNLFDLFLTLIETLFQGIAVQSIIRYKVIGVPTKISEIITYEPKMIAEKLFCYPYNVEMLNNTVKANAVIVNSVGKKIFELKKIEFTTIKTFTENPILFDLV